MPSGRSAFNVSRTALPLSHVSATANISRFCSIRSAIFNKIFDRSVADVLPHASFAAWAASKASSISSSVDRATCVNTFL